MDDVSKESDLHSYALSGKVMCFSVVALLALLFLILCFHLYARFHSRRSTAAESQPRHPPSSCRRRLHPSLLKSSGAHQQGLECAVCLSEFHAADNGCVLLDCRHCFHVDCIDTWFRSHSNCPLCRPPVDPTQNHDSRKIVSRVGEHCAGGNADGSDPDSDSILVQVECRRKAPPRWVCSAAPGLGQEGFAPRDPESGVLLMKR